MTKKTLVIERFGLFMNRTILGPEMGPSAEFYNSQYRVIMRVPNVRDGKQVSIKQFLIDIMHLHGSSIGLSVGVLYNIPLTIIHYLKSHFYETRQLQPSTATLHYITFLLVVTYYISYPHQSRLRHLPQHYKFLYGSSLPLEIAHIVFTQRCLYVGIG